MNGSPPESCCYHRDQSIPNNFENEHLAMSEEGVHLKNYIASFFDSMHLVNQLKFVLIVVGKYETDQCLGQLPPVKQQPISHW